MASRKYRATNTTSTNGITHGTPLTGAATMPRFWLQMKTSTAPATATAPSVRSVMLSGGVVSPWARRRDVRKTVMTA